MQTQYSNYKNILQSLAQRVGEIEQEIEEHKSVLFSSSLCWRSVSGEGVRD